MQDLPVWSERYQETDDSGQFLTATCQDDVAVEVQQELQQLQTRWQQLFKVSLTSDGGWVTQPG